jgi:MurNAc alpha-1-phosphate uridylyltransferase
MLFAAGFGTRMGELTRNRPKPLISVAGRTLLDHALDIARGVIPRRIVVNTHYLSDQIAAYLAGSEVIVSQETPDILETGGGLRHALPVLGDGPVFTLNTDYVWAGPNPLRLLEQAWDPDRMEALLLCLPPDRATGFIGAGDFTVTDGVVRRGPGLIYAGAQIVTTTELDAIPDRVFSLNRLWEGMLARGVLHVLEYPGRWCDVGRPEGIMLAEDMLASGHV